MRRFALLGMLAAVACAATPMLDMGPAPPAPDYLKDLPDDAAAGIHVNYAQAKVGSAAAPDLLTGATTAEAWKRTRRPEIERLLVTNQYGSSPGEEALVTTTRHATSERAAPAMNGLALRTQSSVTLVTELGEHTIDVVLYSPANATGPSPTVLMVNFNPSVLITGDDAVKETDAWTQEGKRIPGREARLLGKPDLSAYLSRGYAVALVYYGQIEPDFAGGSALGLRRVFGPIDEASRATTDSGAVATWAYGLSLVREHLTLNSLVDPQRIALYGVSRLGKTALWAGARDPGFAAVIAVCSGEGGAAMSRREYGEAIAHLAARFPYWFSPRWNSYASDPAASPVDAHMVISMIAPRPLLLIAGETDHWSDPYGEFVAARLATPAWRLFGKTGVDAAPVLDQTTGGELSYLLHTGGHGPMPQDTPAILGFLDRYLSANGS